MTDQIEDQRTAEEIEAEFVLRGVRAGAALQLAPELVGHIRAQSHPTDGRTEAGVLREWRTPLLTGVVDDADEVYSLLHGWVAVFRGTPVTVGWRRADRGDVIGLPAHLSDRGAEAMTYVLTAWILQRTVMIQDHPAAGDFYDEVTETIWRLRAKHQLTRERAQAPAERPCPTCGEVAVHVEFFGQPFVAAERRGEFDPIGAGTADERRDPATAAGKGILDAVSGIDVRCAHCGWVGIPKASQILRWLS